VKTTIYGLAKQTVRAEYLFVHTHSSHVFLLMRPYMYRYSS